MNHKGKWVEDLPHGVAQTFERLVRVADKLPKPPRRSSLHRSSTEPSDASLGLNNVIPTPLQDSSINQTYRQLVQALNEDVPNVKHQSTSPPKIFSDASCNPRPKNVSAQCDTMTDQLTAARERCLKLESRLTERCVMTYLTSADHLSLEEHVSRRNIEQHYFDVSAMLSMLWSEVCRLDAVHRQHEADAAVASSTHATLVADKVRLESKVESLQRMQASLKELVDGQSNALDELSRLRMSLSAEAAERKALEQEVDKLQREKRHYKAMSIDLKKSVAAFREELDRLSGKHQTIVGDLETSLRTLLFSAASSSASMMEPPPNHTIMATSSHSMMAHDVASSGISGKAPNEVNVSLERRKLELQFQLQDCTVELQAVKDALREAKASQALERAKHMEAQQHWSSEKELLIDELKRAKSDREKRVKEAKQLATEVERLQGTVRELGRCRAQLSLSEKRVADLESFVAVKQREILRPNRDEVKHEVTVKAFSPPDTPRNSSPGEHGDETEKQRLMSYLERTVERSLMSTSDSSQEIYPTVAFKQNMPHAASAATRRFAKYLSTPPNVQRDLLEANASISSVEVIEEEEPAS